MPFALKVIEKISFGQDATKFVTVVANAAIEFVIARVKDQKHSISEFATGGDAGKQMCFVIAVDVVGK